MEKQSMENYCGRCLAIGAGAIGKSVTGLTFREMGFHVTFADVSGEAIRDINRRGGYRITTARYGMADTHTDVCGVSACAVASEEAKQAAIEADYICTSVGAYGMEALLPTLTAWLTERGAVSKKPLYLLFFENQHNFMNIVRDAVAASLGGIPQWLRMANTSIERMTKGIITEAGEYDVVAERIFPVFLPRAVMEDSSIARDNARFELVDDIHAYYLRKLYTNNLGHAALGYIGSYLGYHTAVETEHDSRANAVLSLALGEAGALMVQKYGFSRESMDAHLLELPTRYWNPGLNDSLARLARDPLRKLGPEERITGAMRDCAGAGIPIRGMIQIYCFALYYDNEADPSSRELKSLRETKGPEWVLEHISGITSDESLFAEIMKEAIALARRHTAKSPPRTPPDRVI